MSDIITKIDNVLEEEMLNESFDKIKKYYKLFKDEIEKLEGKALSNTEIEAQLKQLGIDQVIIQVILNQIIH